ncbi:MAG: thioredoxin [Chlorobi bacterium]|nr:thioredoxin [Chlorobiota bacterium]
MTTEQFDFQRDVLEKSHEKPVVADFWAEWCAPCRMLAPVLESLAEKYAGSWELVKINTEEHADLASRYGVRGIPNVKLFVDGELVDEFSGALPEYQIEQWLKKAVPSPYTREITMAEEFARNGKNGMAISLLEGVLQKEPGNARAIALLLRIRLFSAPAEALQLVRRLEGEPEYAALAESVEVIARLLCLSKDRLPEDPVRERYADAIGQLAAEHFDEALSGFIDVIRENRSYDDDHSRKACIAVFRYLGEEHEITRKHRKAFDRAFY